MATENEEQRTEGSESVGADTSAVDEGYHAPAFKAWWHYELLPKVLTKQPELWKGLKDHVRELTQHEVKNGGTKPLQEYRDDPTSREAVRDWNDREWWWRKDRADHLAQKPNKEGWVGTPDPNIYHPETTYLSSEELEIEKQKGTVMTYKDFKNEMKNDPIAAEGFANLFALDVLKNNFFIHFENGSRVSFWDLFTYVKDNPHLKKLADQFPLGFPDADGRGEHRALPWAYDPNATQMNLDPEVEAEMPWTRIASSDHWSRRPTPWLRGLDGKRDFSYALYVDEEAAALQLGPSWHQEPAWMLHHPAFTEDLLNAMPGAGATLMFIAARELNLEQLKSEWSERLYREMVDHQGAQASNVLKLRRLHNMFDGDALYRETKLMNLRGDALREGSMFMMTLEEGGKMMVQAISPGVLKERESYMLGVVRDEVLTRSLLSMFMGQRALDHKFVDEVRDKMFDVVRGKSVYHPEGELAAKLREEEEQNVPNFSVEVYPSDTKFWHLPPVGAPRRTVLLVDTISQHLVAKEVGDAFAHATAAVAQLPLPPKGVDPTDAVRHRRAVAIRELGAALTSLSLPLPAGWDPNDLDNLFDTPSEYLANLAEASGPIHLDEQGKLQPGHAPPPSEDLDTSEAAFLCDVEEGTGLPVLSEAGT